LILTNIDQVLYSLLATLVVILTAVINFIPSIIAFKKNHPDKVMILIINALIPVAGFIIALILVFVRKEDRK
jgi:Na+/proline symporter